MSGSRVPGRSLKKTTKSICLLLHTLKSHLLRTSRWMHDYCPIKCFLFPHKSIFSQLNRELLIMPLPLLIFSGLLNFTVVSLPLPEDSQQCFYFPVVCFSSAGPVLSRLNWWQGKTYWKKGICFPFYIRWMRKVFKRELY